MLNFSAQHFFYCGRALKLIRSECVLASAECIDGSPVFVMMRPFNGKTRGKAIGHLTNIEPTFREIGLAITAETIGELLNDLKNDSLHNVQNVQWLLDRIDAIEKLAEKELKQKLFLYIPADHAKFWPTQGEPFAFGRDVQQKFPSASFDIHNAAIGVATTLSTAAVFHLMRVLEIGLAVLGGKFGVSLAHTNWAPAIEEIESKIRDMHKDPVWKALPDCKEQQEFYAQAASHFGILKDAWRNYTMHSRGKYTEDEAERIFENVKGFMQQLAERLHEYEPRTDRSTKF
jgi:hypothetical protein